MSPQHDCPLSVSYMIVQGPERARSQIYPRSVFLTRSVCLRKGLRAGSANGTARWRSRSSAKIAVHFHSNPFVKTSKVKPSNPGSAQASTSPRPAARASTDDLRTQARVRRGGRVAAKRARRAPAAVVLLRSRAVSLSSLCPSRTSSDELPSVTVRIRCALDEASKVVQSTF